MTRQRETRPKLTVKQARPNPPEKVKRPRASRLRNFFSSVKHQLFLALLAGVLACAGAYLGAMFAQKTIWAEQTGYDLTQKRIELIERTVDLMGKSTAVIGQDKNYTRSFLTAMAKTAGDPTKAVGIISKMLKESSETRCNIAEAHAEFMSLLALNEIFFSERTSTAVRALQETDPWWEADSALKADLIEALKADFYHEESP